MKEIVYVVYHNVNNEARSMELLKCCQMMGHVHLVTYAMPTNVDDSKVYLIDKESQFALLLLLKKAKEVIETVRPDIIVLHDNDCSSLISYVKKRYPDSILIYDSSELYISLKDSCLEEREKRRVFENGFKIWLKQKMTFFRGYFEKRDLHKCDIVIAANRERAVIMKDYFHLRNVPIVFDNMHKIEDQIEEKCKKRIDEYIKLNMFNIVFAGGISPERRTIEYCKAVLDLSDNTNLIIVGTASPTEILRFNALKEIDDENKLNYLGFVSRAELRYLFRRCQASVVVFDKYSLNTLYCASGKMYESLFELTPILTSENPPLKRICDEELVGVSDDCFKHGIVKLKRNYSQFKRAVNEYIQTVDYSNRISKLADSIKVEISKLKKQ